MTASPSLPSLTAERVGLWQHINGLWSLPASKDIRRVRDVLHVAVLVAMAWAATAHVAAAQDDLLAALSWLAGCWSADGGEPGSAESWMPPAGRSMFGVSRTVGSGKTVAHEFMQIRATADGKLAFIALPSGQREATFPLLSLSADQVTFENPQHDCPQRVSYRRLPGERLLAQIEGVREGTLRAVDFPMSRVACTSRAMPAAPTDEPEGNKP